MRPDTQNWNAQIILRRLTGTTQRQFESAKPHQVRCWINIIERKLHLERNRGAARHFRYDLNRHMALAAAYRLLNEKLA